MFCTKCGSSIGDNDAFCGDCGAQVQGAPAPAAVMGAQAGVAPSGYAQPKAKKPLGIIAAGAIAAVAVLAAVAIVLPGAMNQDSVSVLASQTGESNGRAYTTTYENDARGNNLNTHIGDNPGLECEYDEEGYLVRIGAISFAQERDLQGRVVEVYAVDEKGNPYVGDSNGKGIVGIPLWTGYEYYESGYVKNITRSYSPETMSNLPDSFPYQCCKTEYDEEGFPIRYTTYETASPLGNPILETIHTWTKDANGYPVSDEQTTKQWENGSLSNTTSSTTQYATDDAGNVVKRTDGKGNVTEYTYDAISNPSARVRAMHGSVVW